MSRSVILPGQEHLVIPDPELAAAIAAAVAAIWDTVYPVGSLYFSVNPANPSTFFGGTWVAFGTGRTLVGVDTGDTDFDTVEETGGAKTHTLTEAEIPAHDHPIPGRVRHTDPGSSPAHGHDDTINQYAGRPTGSIAFTTTAHATQNAGSGGAHNNLQPYITCYIWKRTA